MPSSSMTRLAIALAAAFALLGALHVFWALTRVPDGVRPTFADEALAQPPAPVTLGVAVALGLAATVVLARSGLILPRVPIWISRVACWGLGVIFVFRSIGEFRFVGFFKAIRDTRFAVWDTWLYTPLSLLLGLGAIWLAVRQRPGVDERPPAPGGAVLGLAVLLLAAPGGAREPAAGEVPFPTGSVVEEVTTLHDPDQQYALYLPAGYGASADTTWPILFVLDPRGRAVPGVERFLPAAERHGYIVVSSYQSRSDTLRSVNTTAMEALLREVQSRGYRFDPRRLYLAGMSGTAHAAWRMAQELGEHAAGVIACVGGVQEETQGPPGPARFAYYGITSEIDFNYQETMRLEEHMLTEGIDHHIAFFAGRHGWSPPEVTHRALEWMELQAIRRGLAPADDALVESAYQRAVEAADAAEDPLEKLRRRRDLVRDFTGLREVEAHEEAARAIEAAPEYRTRRKLETRLAKQEHGYFTQRLGPFLGEMRNVDKRPPTLPAARVDLRLVELKQRAASGRHPEAQSARRILESTYSALAFYLPSSFEAAGDLERAARSLEIASFIFPRHGATIWRLAEIQARAGRSEAAFEALRAATALGNVNIERLRTDPTWEALRDEPAWAELLASLEGP